MAYSVPLETLPSLVREFASYKSVIQNASEKTISEYLLDLRMFFRFLIARDKKISPRSDEFEAIDIRGVDLEYIKNITTEDIYDFLMYADKSVWEPCFVPGAGIELALFTVLPPDTWRISTPAFSNCFAT